MSCAPVLGLYVWAVNSLLFDLNLALIISIIWGLSLITIFSYYIAKKQGHSITKSVTEHLFIAILVIIITHFIGKYISILIP